MQKASLTPRRQVRVRRTYPAKDTKGSEVLKPSRVEVASITEEDDSDGSSQSCESLFDIARTFTKDGSPEVCILPACEAAQLDASWRASVPQRGVRAQRKPGSSGNLARTPPVKTMTRGKPPTGKNASRAMSVPAALPSTALCGDYGVYQNDAFGSDSSHNWEDYFDSSSSSDESDVACPVKPESLLKQLPGCPYDAEVVHDLPRTGKRNPLCPFPRRSASPCPARFSSVPPVSIPPTFTVEQSPMFDRGESWQETIKNQTPYQFKAPEKQTQSKAWQKNTRSRVNARFTKGMSAPPADIVRPKLSEDDQKENMDVGMFIATAASARGIKLRDFLDSDALSQSFIELLGPGGLNMSEKKTERKATCAGYFHADTNSRQKDIKIALQRVRICLPGFGPDRSLESIG